MRLVVRKETLSELTSDELADVVGAAYELSCVAGSCITSGDLNKFMTVVIRPTAFCGG